MIIIEPFGGLANRMRVIASGLWLQKQLQCNLICLWSENSELNAPYNQLFENIDGLIVKPKAGKYKYVKLSKQRNLIAKQAVKIINNLLGVDYCIKDQYFAQLTQDEKFGIQEIAAKWNNIYIQTCEEFGDNYAEFQKFIPLPQLKEKINFVESQFANQTIGLHIRRTDNAESIKFSPLELFTDTITLEISKNKDVAFFLSTDDYTIEKELIAKFGDRIITHQKELSRQTVTGMQDAVVDLFCLSNTSKIYGSYWSSFSDIAARIGKISFCVLKI